MTDKDEEILKKALKQAMDNGYIPEEGVACFIAEHENGDVFESSGSFFHSYKSCKQVVDIGFCKRMKLFRISSNYFQLIFSHNFAKAFWGETVYKKSYRIVSSNIKYEEYTLKEFKSKFGKLKFKNVIKSTKYVMPEGCIFPYPFKNKDYGLVVTNSLIKRSWRHHIQQMVREKEPLKYLEKFLD